MVRRIVVIVFLGWGFSFFLSYKFTWHNDRVAGQKKKYDGPNTQKRNSTNFCYYAFSFFFKFDYVTCSFCCRRWSQSWNNTITFFWHTNTHTKLWWLALCDEFCILFGTRDELFTFGSETEKKNKNETFWIASLGQSKLCAIFLFWFISIVDRNSDRKPKIMICFFFSLVRQTNVTNFVGIERAKETMRWNYLTVESKDFDCKTKTKSL